MAWLWVLGSGTGVVSPQRAGPAFLLWDRGAALVDCGPGTLLRLSALGLPPTAVGAVFLTHWHLDHCGDLPALLFARRYPHYPRAERSLLLVGRGVATSYGHLEAAYGEGVRPPDGGPDLREPEVVATWGGWGVEWAAVAHHPTSVAYRFTSPGGSSVVFSGDTGPCEALVRIARGATLLVVECTAPEGSPLQGHLTPSLVGQVAQEAGCARVVLVHLGPDVRADDAVEQVGRWFQGPVLVAEDLMRLVW